MKTVKPCSECGTIAEVAGRGLCRKCYIRAYREGMLDCYSAKLAYNIAQPGELTSRYNVPSNLRGVKCAICGTPAVDEFRHMPLCRDCLCADDPQPYPYTVQAIDARDYNGPVDGCDVLRRM